MKIVVNTRLLLKEKLEGIGLFSFEILKRITPQHTEHQFFFIFDRPFADEFIFSKNIIPIVVSPQTRHPVLQYIWFEFQIPHILRKFNADLFLSPDGYISLSTNVRTVQVIHDINFEHYPQFLPFFAREYYRYFFRRFAKRAHRIATVSEFSKQDIISHYNISPEKIDVVYDGASQDYKPILPEEQIIVRKAFSDGRPYFLFVGALHPRKNIVNMLKAFEKFKENVSTDMKFLFVGGKYWWTKEMENTYNRMKFKKDVIFMGRVTTEILNYIFPSAYALIYTSLFEGFGIPIVEAMYCDIPVITSNVTSMPEIAGDAALLVNPFSVESIAQGMNKIYQVQGLKEQLIEKGRKQREKFSWQKSADLLWNSIEKTMSESNISTKTMQ